MLAGLHVCVPPSDLLEPLAQQMSRLRRMNRGTAATRDLLLPRLVTGRLDISDLDLGALTPKEAV